MLTGRTIVPLASHRVFMQPQKMAVPVDPKSTQEIMDQSNRIGIDFLLADMAAAMTFLDLADTTQSQETRNRNHKNACLAFETVSRLMPRVFPSAEERRALDERFTRLTKRLMALGLLRDPNRNERST